MRNQTCIAVFLAAAAGLSMASQAAAGVAVPVKGLTAAQGSVELLITFHDRAVGGRELYSVTRSLPVSHGVYFGMVEVPDSLFRNRDKVFVGVAHPFAPAIALSTRGQYTFRRAGSEAVSIVGCSFCFTCGLPYTIFQGAFTAASASTAERGSACSGSVILRSDTTPFLCCQ
ncbi:MAG TPA: hypothetical protein VNJ70_05005 [Thermoanaerobaculia bacterium]|nr:hypothetical protein [Thermoanaerobaculia bacterium]